MWAVISPMLDHSKITKIPFWMIQSAKKGFFDHFLELGLLDRLDIAYYESTILWVISILMKKKGQKSKIKVEGHFVAFGWFD